MTNMTKTEIPFGELDDETAAALFLATGGGVR